MQESSEDPRGRIRRVVGRSPERDPLETVWRLRNELKRLGIPNTTSDDHDVRRRIGRPRKEEG